MEGNDTELIAARLPLLVAAVAIRCPLNLRGPGALRRAMDVCANGSVPNPDRELAKPTWGLGEKRFDLRRLDSVEDCGAYCLRLYFDDGRRAEILKYVTARRTLLTRLENRVKRNAP